MLRSIIVLLSCGVGHFVHAHPHCHYDQREVDVGRDLTFCSMEYAPEGICCTEAEEAALEATFNAAGDLTAECADYYKQVLLCYRQKKRLSWLLFMQCNIYRARCREWNLPPRTPDDVFRQRCYAMFWSTVRLECMSAFKDFH